MKATCTSRSVITKYEFQVELDGKEYEVTIFVDSESGKFVDDEISLRGDPLDGEGEDGDIRTQIIDFLDENWESLTESV